MTAKEKARELTKLFGPKLALDCVTQIIAVEAEWAQFIEKRSEYQVNTRKYWMDVMEEITAQ